MKCPICNVSMRVVDTRQKDRNVRRRHECPECLTRYSTTEKIMYEFCDEFILKKIHIATGGTTLNPSKAEIVKALNRGEKPIYKVAEEMGISNHDVMAALGQGDDKKKEEQ